jgi:hypothetical protein
MTFLWYYEQRGESKGASCYSSTDLYDWKKEGIVIEKGDIQNMQTGIEISRLGAFEHWVNAENMQYSRNIDPENGKGIEFLFSPLGSKKIIRKKY